MGEKRLSREEFKQRLIEFQKSRPVVMNEEEYARELDETVLLRYERGVELLDRVVAELERAKRDAKDQARANELDLAVRAVDEAITAFNYGHVGHNRCGKADKAAHSRAVLWYEPKAGE